MNRKFIASLLVLSTMCLMTGCGDTDTISELNSISALNTDSSVTSSYNLSWSDEQEMIYAQVSDRQLLDLSALSACSDNELQQVQNYMNLVDNQLIGNIAVNSYRNDGDEKILSGLVVDNAVIDAKLTDYLLAFMEKTPYYWQRSKTIVRGIDSESRSIIVDVQYKTIDFEKEVKKDSSLVKGDPNYDRLAESRYNKWINILSTQLNNPNDSMLMTYINDFKQYWGEPEEIIEEQRLYSNTVDVYMTGNQKTYSGLVDSEAEKTGGSMTVRYVLVPEYVLGINLGITCEHMYVTEFSLDSDVTEGLSSFTQEGYQTVTDNVYSLIYSYFTCLDESDFEGLYSLTSNFQGLDKHYDDVFSSTYQKHQGYSVSLFDITGTHITCGVTISTKERAKGSNMTFPVYTDRYYMELELVEDTLKVNNMVLLSRRLEGEPAINEGAVDTTGFSATIELDNDDKVAIENLICDFSALQLNSDTQSDSFSDVVDNSVTTNQLSSIKTNMTSLSGAKKVVFLQNYQQGTSNYASVKCKELYQDDKNAIVEASVTYEFILKGGKWYVYNYDVNSSVKLDTTNLQTTGSLCLVSPGKVEAYTSQIKGSTSTNLDEVSDISVSFDHKEYKPKLKEAVVEQGYELYTANDISNELYSQVANVMGTSYVDMSQLDELLDTIATISGDSNVQETVKETLLNAMAVYLNIAENRYANELESSQASTQGKDDLDTLSDLLDTYKGGITNPEDSVYFDDLSKMIQSVDLLLRD